MILSRLKKLERTPKLKTQITIWKVLSHFLKN